MSPAWSFALGRLAAAIAIAAGLGLISGRIGLWLTIVLGGLLAWQLVNLFRLQRWLQHRSEEVPPDLGGVWGDVVALIGRIYRRKQFHKRRVTQLFREFRRLDGGAAGWRRAAVARPRNPLVQSNGRGAARPARRLDRRDPDRKSGPAARILGLPERAWRRLRVVVRARRRRKPRSCCRDSGGRTVPDAGARRDARGATRADAQGFRRECLA